MVSRQIKFIQHIKLLLAFQETHPQITPKKEEKKKRSIFVNAKIPKLDLLFLLFRHFQSHPNEKDPSFSSRNDPKWAGNRISDVVLKQRDNDDEPTDYPVL